VTHPPRCLAPHPFVPAILCGLAAGHDGEHQGRAYWSPAGDGPPTVRLPPITDTVRRRPPVPDVRELRGPELLDALADELRREAAELRTDAPDDSPSVPALCDRRPGCFDPRAGVCTCGGFL
jgi:hypothetical protein